MQVRSITKKWALTPLARQFGWNYFLRETESPFIFGYMLISNQGEVTKLKYFPQFFIAIDEITSDTFNNIVDCYRWFITPTEQEQIRQVNGYTPRWNPTKKYFVPERYTTEEHTRVPKEMFVFDNLDTCTKFCSIAHNLLLKHYGIHEPEAQDIRETDEYVIYKSFVTHEGYKKLV